MPVEVYQSKPKRVEAIQFDGTNGPEIRDWARDESEGFPRECFITKSLASTQAWNFIKGDDWGPEIVAAVYDKLHDTWVGVRKHNMIIKGLEGEFYPCAWVTFEQSYEKAPQPLGLCTCLGADGPHELMRDGHAAHCPARGQEVPT